MILSNIIKTIEMDCPICNKSHAVEERTRNTQALVKGEIIDYEQRYYLCPITDLEENEFVPAGLMDDNLLTARDAYRIMNGLLSSGEIAGIRHYYGLSQSDFAFLLGWGEITVTRYESKSIQDETYDNLMRMVYSSPLFALESLDKHKDRFSADKLVKIRNNIKKRIMECGNLHLKRQEIESSYIGFEEECDLNGYKKLDIDKLSRVLGYFACTVDMLYKVKLMKLLWYNDSIYFRRHGESMTGLVYQHKPLGALPLAFEEIVCLPTITVVEELINDDIAYRICANGNVNIDSFSSDEMSVLQVVADKFSGFNTKSIIEYMHAEVAYRDTKPNQFIPYSLARQLNELT